MATFPSLSTALLFCTLLLFAIHPSTNASNDEPTQERLDAFWESFSAIASTRNRRLNGIAKRIAQIGLELNQSSSACYESIQLTLSQDLAQPWSTKSKCTL